RQQKTFAFWAKLIDALSLHDNQNWRSGHGSRKPSRFGQSLLMPCPYMTIKIGGRDTAAENLRVLGKAY
ncbi:hypothetical protein, partial [Microseira sp. BLCC-F43]|uniref:hypothetical protein n=1 Tax=Microseira sp. BLCC-F43 TaxID=3153602 RepID=UPI0035BB6FA4